MSIVSTTRCGMLGYKLTDEIVQQNLGFNNEIFKEFGYFFGIDGAGYSFYEKHWIPLYKARGFQWHKENEEE